MNPHLRQFSSHLKCSHKHLTLLPSSISISAISRTRSSPPKQSQRNAKMSSTQKSLPKAIPITSAYYNFPHGSPRSMDGSFSPPVSPISAVPSSKLEIFGRIASHAHEEPRMIRSTMTNPWESYGQTRKSSESSDSKRPTFSRTGRHSNDWLFRGFSFRQTAKRVFKS